MASRPVSCAPLQGATRRIAAVAAVYAALLTETAAAETLRLRYGFRPQATYQQAIGLNLVVTLDPASTPAPLLALLQAMSGEVKQDVASKASLQTKTRNADGSLPFQYKIVEAKGTMTQGGQVKPIPALEQAAAKPPADGRVAPDGKSLALEAPPEGTDAIPMRVRERIADSFPNLPDRDLRVGDSFEARTVLTLPKPGKGERQVQTIWVYTLKSLDPKAATFDVRQTIPPAAPTQAEQGQGVDVTGGGSGSAVFDRATGLFGSIRMDLDLTMLVDLPLPAGLSLGGSTTRPDGTSQPAPTRLKVFVKGPMVTTLAPATSTGP